MKRTRLRRYRRMPFGIARRSRGSGFWSPTMTILAIVVAHSWPHFSEYVP